MRVYHVYILAGRSRALYIGVTGNLTRRVHAHRAGMVHTTARYRIQRLVYVEDYAYVRDAIRREKQLKGWTRARKLALIATPNPAWDELMTFS